MDFTGVIDGAVMRFVLSTDRPLSGAILCCSGIGPLSCVSGGKTQFVLGSQIEIALPDLRAGADHEIVLQYDGRTPSNRAWLPQAPYLRHGAEIIHLLGSARHDFNRIAVKKGFDLWIDQRGRLALLPEVQQRHQCMSYFTGRQAHPSFSIKALSRS